MPHPPTGPNQRKRVRCKWYNDLGYPRINPEKQKRGFKDPRGCRFPSQKCYYAHPDHPDWSAAALSPYIQPTEYPDGRVPATPDPDDWPPARQPPSAATKLGKRKSRSRSRSRSGSIGRRMSGSRTRMRTPEKRVYVKEEPRSPVLHPGYRNRSRSASRDRGKERYGNSASASLVNRVGPRRSISPYGRRGSGIGSGPGASSRDYSRDRDRDRDREREKEKGGYYKANGSYGNMSSREREELDKGWKSNRFGREQDKGWDRGNRRASDSTRFNPPSFEKQGFYSDRADSNSNTHKASDPPSPPRPRTTAAGGLDTTAGSGSGSGIGAGSDPQNGTGSVLDRLFSRDPSLGSGPTEPSLKTLLSTLGFDPPKAIKEESSNDKIDNNTSAQDQNQGAFQASSSGSIPSILQPPAPSDPPPSIPLPPPSEPHPQSLPASAPSTRPLSPLSRSLVASSTTTFVPVSNTGVTPGISTSDGTMSTTSLSMSMPPPATPTALSAASSTTFAGSFSAATTPTAVPQPNAYVVPSKPAFLAPTPTPENFKREELTREERAMIWDKRIELLSEAIAAKRASNERIADVKQLEAFASPERTASLPAAAREKVTASLASARRQVEAAQERVRLAQQKVLELDFWPVRRRPEEYDPVKKDQIKAEQEEKEKERKLIEDAQEEIRDRMNGLCDAVAKLDKKMKEVALLVSARARPGGSGMPASASAPPEIESMDWEPTDGPHGMKRRKTGDDGVYASDSGSVAQSPTTLAGDFTPTSATVNNARDREIRLLTHRLAKLESSFHELENLFHQDEEHREDELAQLVESHVELVREELIRGVKVRQGEKAKKLAEDVQLMDKEVTALGNEVAELYERLGGVIALQSRLEEERARVQVEREKLRTAIEENNSRTGVMQAQIEANIEETQTLRQTLSSLPSSSNASRPHPPAHTPSLENLTQALLPRLLDAVRADLEKKILEQKADVIKLVRETVLGSADNNAIDTPGTQQNQTQHMQMEKVKETIETIMKNPEVIAALQRSGALNANGNANSNVVNGSGMDVDASSQHHAQLVNGTSATPTPPP
ncbi:hypothetical protein A7U60_g8744 [Sanghuangporus baumii]|uniref:Uncharacterized protein n=1 Tax=Sanghuangporus baumii TaxID=108892 RepID=A0A9Q5HQD4_SANBA|nr:hypothetical protein A7U60_g8744 [Sanghuangporus baumii]